MDAKPNDSLLEYGFRVYEIRTRVSDEGLLTVTLTATNGHRIVRVSHTSQWLSDAMDGAMASLQDTVTRMYRSS